MEKQAITEEMHPEKEWFEMARSITTAHSLSIFIEHVLKDYIHDYGTVCHAVSACAVAAASYAAHVQGITGFQAGFVMWDFISAWNHKNNKCGMKLIDYDNMLYPQYDAVFEKTISQETMNTLMEEARKNLEERPDAHPDVVAHWKQIADGHPPFGYQVNKEGW